MKESLALTAYGLLILSGLFMTIFWGQIAWRRRITVQSCKAARYDKYAMLASCLFLSSVGTVIFFLTRTAQFLEQGISTVSAPGYLSMAVLGGLYILVVAKAGFVWAVNMDRHSWMWKSFIALSICWVILAEVWVYCDPIK